MKKTTDQIKLTQNQRDLSVLEDERKALLAEIEGLEPELRHGDYGIYCGRKAIAITNSKGRLVMSQPSGSMDCQEADIHETQFKENILGNIFDDLAALAEPLERFEVKRDEHNIIKAYHGQCMDDKNSEGIQFEATCNGETTTVLFPIDQATEIHRGLGRLIAKLKLDKAKK